MKRIGVLTSGGDSPGMNAAVRAIVRSGIYSGAEVYGIRRGFEGLIEGEVEKMELSSVSDILHRGGTVLKTARSKRFTTEDGMNKALETLAKFKADALVVIGGDGSLRGANELSKRGITVMGLPGTIDNDLAYTDYSIGFDTAVNTILHAISNIRDTSSSHDCTTVIEVMGRHCGDIALYSGLAGGAEFILIPEEENDLEALCRKITAGRKRGKLHSIIVKAEGVDISNEELASHIKEHTGFNVRIVVPGYIQRGGSPTARDRILASLMAYKAVSLILEESQSMAIGVRGEEITACPIGDAIAKIKKHDLSKRMLSDILSI